jgi:hypothetical protein
LAQHERTAGLEASNSRWERPKRLAVAVNNS